MMSAKSSVMARCHAVPSCCGVFAAFLLCTPLCSADDRAGAGGTTARYIDASVRWAADLGEACRLRLRTVEKLTTKAPPQPSAVVEMGRRPHEERAPDLANALIYYRAVYAWLEGDKKAFAEEERKSREAGVFLPDLLLYDALNADKVTARVAAWMEYGRIAPMSLDGRSRDWTLSHPVLVGLPNPPPPRIAGMGSEDRLVKIGELYADRGLYEQAVDSHVESLFLTPFSCKGRGATWLAVAKIEAQRSQPQLAVRAYLQAAHSSPKLCEEAREGIAGLFNTKTLPRKESVPRELDAGTASKIAELYRRCNLHPLALRVLSEPAVASEADATARRQAIEKEWLGIVAEYKELHGDRIVLPGSKTSTVLLGAKASEVKSWAGIHVLRPSDTYWKRR